ncbi:hypothetical protein O7635_07665 [Asanoa sp. WMMD1127]|uniref:hypothetical protein n=1 Tax=Asanoa sp. WMMD1127 TaxID=3016107 RepID=UPI0024169ACC|nr:hypothetical protein [Asanoa sp. WMMD1127]MDG4821729.1 hypothetical protein [Asanoa sp. WMMD1127]
MTQAFAGVHIDPPPVDDFHDLLFSSAELARRIPNVTHLSLVADGDLAFSIDQFEIDPVRRRQARIAVQGVVGSCLDLHDKLQVARTGALIRLVLETPRGAVLAYAIPGRGYLAGFCLRDQPAEPTVTVAPEVQEADRALAGLVSEARELFGLEDQNPGGFQPIPAGVELRPPTGQPVITGTGAAEVLEVCRAAVDERLQYVLYQGGDGTACAVDCFGGLAQLETHGDTTPARLRRVYWGFHTDLDGDLRDLRRLVYPVLGRSAKSVVLDVEDGVVMNRWLGGGRQLLGVTLTQSYVASVEDRFAELSARLADL